MANVSPPKYVKHILITLQSRGHAAYLVGGCVGHLHQRPAGADAGNFPELPPDGAEARHSDRLRELPLRRGHDLPQ